MKTKTKKAKAKTKAAKKEAAAIKEVLQRLEISASNLRDELNAIQPFTYLLLIRGNTVNPRHFPKIIARAHAAAVKARSAVIAAVYEAEFAAEDLEEVIVDHLNKEAEGARKTRRLTSQSDAQLLTASAAHFGPR